MFIGVSGQRAERLELAQNAGPGRKPYAVPGPPGLDGERELDGPEQNDVNEKEEHV